MFHKSLDYKIITCKKYLSLSSFYQLNNDLYKTILLTIFVAVVIKKGFIRHGMSWFGKIRLYHSLAFLNSDSAKVFNLSLPVSQS